MSAGRLKDKVAIVTGASTGIGAAIAECYAAEGAKVILADVNVSDGEATTKKINDAGGSAEFVETNMKDREQVKSLVEKVVKDYYKIDILTNSVGIMFSKPFMECTEEDWWEVMDTNVLSHIYAMWEVLPVMQKQKDGSVINVASKLGAPRPNDREAFYTYASAALNMVSRAAQTDYAQENIRINVLAPGLTRTSWTENDERAKKFLEAIPMGRYAEPEEIAKSALFLASDDASYVSGLCLQVDGGHVGGEHVTAED